MNKTGILFALAATALFFGSCHDRDADYIDPRGTDYAGSQSCIQCHPAAYKAAMQSAHFKATAPAIAPNMLGHFNSGKNSFAYNQSQKLQMEKRGDSFYQVLYKQGKEIQAYRMDIVFGSRKAQTAVYWRGPNTFELPVSHYQSVDAWATSPGFSAAQPYFDRKAVKDCYACHSSNAGSKMISEVSGQSDFLSMDAQDVMNPKTLVYGIDCERCHGPAKKHAAYQMKFPALKTAKYITVYKSLDPGQKSDACAVCHSGTAGLKIKSRFEFRPGDRLSDYYRVPVYRDTAQYDVHGNQAGLVSQSKCFQKSQALDCTSCHNPHENAAQSPDYYSKICLDCHQNTKHKSSAVRAMALTVLKNNCIDCHMPNQKSKAIRFQLSGSKNVSGYALRNHRIAVYPNEQKPAK